tara:strand:- start:54 stop:515 length:462 start_codon:yes stop_codon:yes gene_type:complete
MSTVQVDTINESTTGSGVTVDGVLIKDTGIESFNLKDYSETIQTLTSSSGVVSVDMNSGNVGTITLSENVTDIDFTNVPTSGAVSFVLQITQDSSDRTVAINAITVNAGSHVTAKTVGAGGYTMTTGSGKIDIVTFIFFNAGTPHLNALQDMG